MEGRRISADEMISMVLLLGAGSETTTHLISGSVYVLLLGAGSETTIHLISGSVYELLKNPTLRDRLNEDRRRAGLAVEEFLRFVSPVQFTKPRFVRRDVELGGVQLKRGDRIMAMLAAANMRGRSSSISSGGYPLANLRSACMMWHTLAYDVGPTPFSTTDAHRH